MAVSATDKELLKYFLQLDESQKKSLLQLIKTFLKAGNDDKRVTIAQLQPGIG